MRMMPFKTTPRVKKVRSASKDKDYIALILKGGLLNVIEPTGKDLIKQRFWLSPYENKMCCSPPDSVANYSTAFRLENVVDIRPGWMSNLFRNCFTNCDQQLNGKQRAAAEKYWIDMCFTIHLDNGKVLYLAANSVQGAKIWIRALSSMICKLACDPVFGLTMLFRQTDKARTGRLNHHQCRRILHQLNFLVQDEMFEEVFNSAANMEQIYSKNDSEQFLEETQFVWLYQMIKAMPLLDALYMEYFIKSRTAAMDRKPQVRNKSSIKALITF